MSAASVRCWFCGHKARRKPKGEPLPVINRSRRVQPYGICNAKQKGGVSYDGWSERCTCPMLLPEDARYVLRAAIEHENGDGNSRSEYDG